MFNEEYFATMTQGTTEVWSGMEVRDGTIRGHVKSHGALLVHKK